MAAANKISFCSLRLKGLLNRSFRELSGNSNFIDKRGRLVAKSYNDGFMTGNTI